MMQIQECVRSLVPGRVRIRHPALKGLTSEDEKLLVQTAKSVEGILAVRVNPAVGSLLIVWDEDVLSQQELCEALEFLATALGLDVGKHFVRNFVVGKFYLPAEAEGSCILPLLHYLVEADERAAADEQDIGSIYAQHLLLGVFSAALGRHVGNGAFNNL